MKTCHSWDYTHCYLYHHTHDDNYENMLMPCCHMTRLTLRVGHSDLWVWSILLSPKRRGLSRAGGKRGNQRDLTGWDIAGPEVGGAQEGRQIAFKKLRAPPAPCQSGNRDLRPEPQATGLPATWTSLEVTSSPDLADQRLARGHLDFGLVMSLAQPASPAFQQRSMS